MNKDSLIKEIRRDVLVECSEDYVGVWSVIWLLRRKFSDQSEAEIRQKALDVIRPLLEDGLIEAGPIEGDWSEAWAIPSPEILYRIEAGWDELGHEPKMWDICWFRTTQKGDLAVQALTKKD